MSLLSLGSLAKNLTSQKEVFLFCINLLAQLDSNKANKQRAKLVVKAVESGNKYNSDLLNKTLRSIISEINLFVPPFSFFGAHPTEYDNYGVWIDLEALHTAENDGRLIQVSKDIKGIKSPYILKIDDNGIKLVSRKKKSIIWEIR